MIYLEVAVIVSAIGGIIAAFFVSRRPEFLWPLFIGLPLATSGLVTAGYALVDEYLMGCLLIGGILAVQRKAVHARALGDAPPAFHRRVFLFTVTYLFLESVRGALFLGDVRILRWAGFYLLFGAFLLLTRKWQFPLPSASLAARVTGAASVLYFGSYFLIGIFYECVRGVVRWGSQAVVWAGSSYAIFPLILSFPAALFLLKSEERSERRLGWAALFISVFTAGYYESRMGWLAVLGMLLFVPAVLGLRRALKAAPGLLLVFGSTFLFTLSPIATPYWWDGQLLEMPYCHALLTGKATSAEAFTRLSDAAWYKVRATTFTNGLAATVIAPATPRASDVDRTLHLKAAFLAVSEAPLRLFFGGGTYSHRVLLRPPLVEFYREKLPGVEVPSVVRTAGLTAIVVDFGLVGLALVALNLVLAMKALISGRRWFEWGRASILLFALFLIPFWLAVSNIQDMVVYFSLLMPGNIFTLLLRVP